MCEPGTRSRRRRSAERRRADPSLGAKDCTPEVDTSEVIADFQWHLPMDFQWHLPTDCPLSAVVSKGLSPGQRIFTEIVQWIFSGILQWTLMCVISGV